jgi:PAS domain S-box-containing protein
MGMAQDGNNAPENQHKIQRGKMKEDGNDKDRLIRVLKETAERYRLLAETSIDAIMTSDRRDIFTSWDGGSETMFGYGREVIGAPVITIIPEKYRKAHQEGMRKFLETGERHILGKKVELEAIKKDGTEFNIELSLSSWENDSNTYFGAIIRDISDRKQLERVREDVQRIMRHDIKSPLIGITGLAKILMKGGTLTSQQKKAAGLILELGERTINFINRSRDLFQIEQGVFKLTPREMDLTRILNTIHKSLESLSLKKDINLKITISGKPIEKGHGYLLQGDEGLVEVLLANLIKNAIEGAPEMSDVLVSIDLQEIEGISHHIIDIHNKGVIPHEIRDRFFDAYITSGKSDGTGLGTYSARLIAGAHRGSIRFTTSEEEGTHVIVELPVDIETPQE